MEIGTKVFEKITREYRLAAIETITDIMMEADRFGCFTKEHCRPIAEMFFKKWLRKIRKDTQIKTKGTKVIDIKGALLDD